jgi:S-adenosylmethionine/arginine decarboxylase-like enzyme
MLVLLTSAIKAKISCTLPMHTPHINIHTYTHTFTLAHARTLTPACIQVGATCRRASPRAALLGMAAVLAQRAVHVQKQNRCVGVCICMCVCVCVCASE